MMEILAHAKLNLSLDILRKREDGYHDLKMVMHSVDLSDTLTLDRGGGDEIQVSTNLTFLPNNDKNLAAVAARRFAEATGYPVEGMRINIDKQIPVCAGMAGGSSDAAAVLRALNREAGEPLSLSQLAAVGEKVGSDVPYCVFGGTALVEGRGEIVTPLPQLPECWFVICKPNFSISTPELFSKVNVKKLRCRPDTDGILSALEVGDLEGVARRMYNVFEDVLDSRKKGEIADLRSAMVGHGALGSVMSGSGPTVFAIFTTKEEARAACEDLKQDYRQTFLARSV